MLHTSAHFLKRFSAPLVGIHGSSLPRATVGVPGGRCRSVAERVLSYTAVGFVLAILVAVYAN
jgi:hypothetical protein